MESLKEKTISGIFWSLLQNVGGKAITFLVMIILARLLSPRVFGLVGLLMIFIFLSQTLVMSGFNKALIQKRDTDEEDYSSVFWINLIVSLILYGILFISAPFIAEFYGESILTKLTRVFSIIFVIDAFSYVQVAKLTKEMKFKTLMLTHLPSTIIGGVISIVMAFLGYGVWSIIALQIVTRLAYSIQIWIYSRWIPLLKINFRKAKTLFSFGSKLMISGILYAIFQNIYLVVIGRFYSISSVGYFQNANNLVLTPLTTISNALTQVAFPTFSSIQDDDEKLRKGFKKITQHIVFWLCPIFVIAGVLSVPLFRFVFTEKWLPAVPYFRLLCIAGIMHVLYYNNLEIVNVKGRSDLFLKFEFVKMVFTVIGLLVILPFGIYALLIFHAGSSIVFYLVNAHYSGGFIDYSLSEQLKDIMPFVLLSLTVGVLVFAIDKFLMTELPDLLRLILGSLSGFIIYIIIAKKNNFSPFVEFQNIVKSRLLKNSY